MERKAFILKQRKPIRIADREEDGWKDVKCDLSDNLVSDLEEKKQLNKARRKAASNKKKREANKHKDNKKQFRNVPFFRRSIETSSRSNQGQSSYKNQFRTSRNRYFCEKEEHFQYDCSL